ncbi:MAG: type II toxin-antitoxin system VapC family toxin [Burkholderiaceae bacterium]|nr:type II toxin-antitoxin system VapC family toxin [Burkholderiaceae bacterium]MCD8536401.1 type II toxin-antitoxin system VapC family toxin [Burkholderiaceae bacterium]
MRAQAELAKAIAVSRIAWAEAMAALARRARESPADAEVIENIRANLRSDWPSFATVEVTQALVELAGEYADVFALRGYDSVQLASARTIQDAADEPLCFACFDLRLQKSAAMLGMQTLGKI